MKHEPHPADAETGSHSLARRLRVWDATAIVVGGIIGSGIFVAPAIVAGHVGSPVMALLVWVTAGGLACCGALCYAELGASMPDTGGTYRYLQRAYSAPLVAFLFGWTFFLVDGPGSIAAVATTFATYTCAMFDIQAASPRLVRAIAAGLIVAVTAVNYRGVRQSAMLQNAATVLKVAALAGIVAVAAWIWLHSVAAVHAVQLEPGHPAPVHVPTGSFALAGALVPALFAYDGWTYSSYVAGEMINPRRDIPRSIILGTLIVIVIYVAVNLADMAVLPFHELQRSTHVASDVMERAVGPVGRRLVAGAVMVSTFGALNAIVLIYPRIALAMAWDGLFFDRMRTVHRDFQTPGTALLVQGVIATTFAVSGTYEDILGYFAFVEFLFYAIAIAAVIVLRRRFPSMRRPFRVFGYPIPPLIFLTVGAWYLTTLLRSQWRGSLVGIALMLTGVPFYLRWRHHQR